MKRGGADHLNPVKSFLILRHVTVQRERVYAVMVGGTWGLTPAAGS